MPVDFFAELLCKNPPEKVLADAPERHLDIFHSAPHLSPLLPGANHPDHDAQSLFEFQDFQQFLASYLFTSYFFREVADFRDLIQAVRRTLVAQNIVYAEVTVSLIEYLNQGLRLEEMVEAMEEASDSPEIRIRWIIDLVRDFGAELTLDVLRKVLARKTSTIGGITLGGSEHRVPAGVFKEHYALARDHGLGLTVHAGEAAGPESVWDAIQSLGVDRIGHGVRSIEDPRLVDYLVKHQIPLEICPTSNLKTGVYPSYEAHPVCELYRAGVAISISTDDPSFFDTTLAGELEQIGRLGLDEEDRLELLKNGFRHAFLPQEEISAYIGELERCRAILERGGGGLGAT
jgi:adenosine deaminase